MQGAEGPDGGETGVRLHACSYSVVGELVFDAVELNMQGQEGSYHEGC